MEYFLKPHWHFAESRLIWLESGQDVDPSTQEVEKLPQEKPTETSKPEIDKPPTEDADKVLLGKLQEAADDAWKGKDIQNPEVFEEELQKLILDFKSESQGKETGRGIMYDLNTLFVYCPEDQKQAVVQRILSMNPDWRAQGLEIRYNGQLFNADEILTQAVTTNAENNNEQKATEVKKVGLSEKDRANKEVSEKNISTSLDNLEFVKEAKEQLQGRLQSWVESSVSKYVDVVNDQLSTTQSLIQKDMERHVRLVRELYHSVNGLDSRIIQYINEKAQLDPSDERHNQLTRLIGETIQEANVASKEEKRESDRLMDTFDETDIALDEKKGAYTVTYSDKKIDASDDVILKQFEDGFHSKSIAKNLIDALRSKKPIIGLFGSTKTVNLEMAEKKAQEIFQKMTPEQQKVFGRWLQREVKEAGLDQKVTFEKSGKIKIEK